MKSVKSTQRICKIFSFHLALQLRYFLANIIDVVCGHRTSITSSTEKERKVTHEMMHDIEPTVDDEEERHGEESTDFSAAITESNEAIENAAHDFALVAIVERKPHSVAVQRFNRSFYFVIVRHHQSNRSHQTQYILWRAFEENLCSQVVHVTTQSAQLDNDNVVMNDNFSAQKETSVISGRR